MKKRLRLVSLLLVLCMVAGLLPMTVLAAGLPFTDVNLTDWFYGDVRYVYENGLMNGTGENRFSPAMAVTRGTVVTILHRMAGEPVVAGDLYADVAENTWYAHAVSWASVNGIVTGYGNGEFGPDDFITREQLATILYRYDQTFGTRSMACADLSAYTDYDQMSVYAKEAVSWAVAEGLITGMENNSLDPAGTATRAQLAAILARYCRKDDMGFIWMPGWMNKDELPDEELPEKEFFLLEKCEYFAFDFPALSNGNYVVFMTQVSGGEGAYLALPKTASGWDQNVLHRGVLTEEGIVAENGHALYLATEVQDVPWDTTISRSQYAQSDLSSSDTILSHSGSMLPLDDSALFQVIYPSNEGYAAGIISYNNRDEGLQSILEQMEWDSLNVYYKIRDNMIGEVWIKVNGDGAEAYDVTFMGNIDETGVYETQQIEAGGYVEAPGTPIYSGYVFKGWSLSETEEDWFDFSTPVSEDLTLYAHWYTLEEAPVYDVQSAGELESTVYGIADLAMEGQCATAIVNTVDNCTLNIRFYDEETGEEYCVEEAAILGNVSMEPVSVIVNQMLPAYFAVELQLVDDNGKDLCDPYICTDYTRAYEELLSLTPADFASDRVVYFTDSRSEDYAVLNEDVIRVETTDTSNVMVETEEGVVFENVDSTVESLNVGDKVAVVEDDIILANFTVASVSKVGDQVIVVRDESGLTDYYELIDLEITDAEGGAAQTYANRSQEKGKEFEVKLSHKATANLGDFSAEAGFSGKLTIDLSVKYWKKIITTFSAETKVDGTTSLSIEYSRDKDLLEGNNTPLNIKDLREEETKLPFPEIDVPTPIPGIAVPVQFSIPLKVKAAASLNAENTVTVIKGVQIDLLRLKSNTWEDSYSAFTGSAKGEVEVKLGIEGSIGVELIQVSEVGITAGTGAKIKGEAEYVFYQDTTAPSVHGCDLCIDGDISFYRELGLYVEIGTKKIFEIKPAVLEKPLDDFYVSLINHIHSCHGGEIRFGMGDCPNDKWRVTVVAEEDQSEVAVPVTVSYEDGTDAAVDKTPMICYLYNGGYTASAQFADGTRGEKEFTVSDAAMEIVIEKGTDQGGEGTLFLLPMDYAKPIEDTTITVPGMSDGLLYATFILINDEIEPAYVAAPSADHSAETLYRATLVRLNGVIMSDKPVYYAVSEFEKLEWDVSINWQKQGVNDDLYSMDDILAKLENQQLHPDATVGLVVYDVFSFGVKKYKDASDVAFFNYTVFGSMDVYTTIENGMITEMWVYLFQSTTGVDK